MKKFQDQIDKKHLFDLFNLTDNLLSYVDTEYIYRAVNDAYIRKYKKSADEIIGRYVWEVMGKDMFEKIIQPNLQKAFLGATVEYEAWFEFPNLPKSYLIVTYKPTFSDDLIVDGVVVSAVDYTKFKELEEKKEEQEIIFQEISKMAQLGEMISFISHQWRQPLNTLATYMLKLRQLTSGKPDTLKAIERCETILEELSSHVESINSLYASNTNQTLYNIKNIFDSILILVHDRACLLGVEISIDCSNGVTVTGHRDEIIHILLAVIENAIDSLSRSDESVKQITITTHSENNDIVIDIQDSGDGISLEDSKHIFESGFTTKESRGHGYGLYFAHKLLTEKLGGSIEVRSIPLKGAWFRLKLPSDLAIF